MIFVFQQNVLIKHTEEGGEHKLTAVIADFGLAAPIPHEKCVVFSCLCNVREGVTFIYCWRLNYWVLFVFYEWIRVFRFLDFFLRLWYFV